MSDKFGRHFRLRLETNDKKTTGVNSDGSLNIESQGNIIEINDPLTLEFHVKRAILSSASTGSFRVYNLGAITRRRVYKDPFNTTQYRSVELLAGYDKNPPLIFKGNIKEAKSYRQEGATEMILEVDAFDGGFATSYAFSSLTVKPTMTLQDVLNNLKRDMTGYHVTDGITSDYSNVTYPRGKALIDRTASLIQGETNGAMFIDLERIFILKPNDCLAATIPIISSETGLLGSPKRRDQFIECEILFEPRLILGQIVQLISIDKSNMNGFYKVYGVEHFGTISGAVGGPCKTIVSLWLGDGVLEQLSGGIAEPLV